MLMEIMYREKIIDEQRDLSKRQLYLEQLIDARKEYKMSGVINEDRYQLARHDILIDMCKLHIQQHQNNLSYFRYKLE